MTPTQTLDPVDTHVSAGSSSWRWVVVVVVALVLAVGVKAWAVESWFVPDASMAPALEPGDRVVLVKPGTVARGDVVVVDLAGAFPGPTREPYVSGGFIGRTLARVSGRLGVGGDSRSVVAQVVAVEGDTVGCCTAGQVTVGERPVGAAGDTAPFSFTVPTGSVWVLGTRPDVAIDSREYAAQPGHGVVPTEAIAGRVVGRFWPLSRWGGIGASTS